MALFDRGFKSWAERTSISLRKDLRESAFNPLPIEKAASHLNVRLLTPQEIPGLPKKHIDQLLVNDPQGWSATSFQANGQHVIIYNPAHSRRRQASDKMHEIAHIILGHDPSKMILSQNGEMVMRTYDQKQEDEASWLSGCLLLPRTALVYVKKNHWVENKICDTYGVSEEILRYRMNVTGVNAQLARFSILRKTA